MTWKALVAPRKNTVDLPGMCLRFSQTFFGAPVRYPDAWTAWENQEHRHPASEPLPDVPVLLWFSHYGTYGDPAYYKNWGHVAPYVPGDAIYSSPATWNAGWSQSRFETITDLEWALNCKYVGWSESINGLRVAAQVDTPAIPPAILPKKRKNKSMFIVYYANAAPKDPKFKGRWAVTGSKYWLELTTQSAANNIANQLGITKAFVCNGDAPWNKFKQAAK